MHYLGLLVVGLAVSARREGVDEGEAARWDGKLPHGGRLYSFLGVEVAMKADPKVQRGCC